MIEKIILETIEKELVKKLKFRHESPNFFKILKPVTYIEVAKSRDLDIEDEYLKDRIKTELKYKKLLNIKDKEKSFLYGTIVNFHKMDLPKDYPGYTYYFHLSKKQIESTIFEVVDKNYPLAPMVGFKGLLKAINHWNKYRSLMEDYEDPIVGLIQPRLEVVINYEVHPYAYVPQIEDRK